MRSDLQEPTRRLTNESAIAGRFLEPSAQALGAFDPALVEARELALDYDGAACLDVTDEGVRLFRRHDRDVGQHEEAEALDRGRVHVLDGQRPRKGPRVLEQTQRGSVERGTDCEFSLGPYG